MWSLHALLAEGLELRSTNPLLLLAQHDFDHVCNFQRHVRVSMWPREDIKPECRLCEGVNTTKLFPMAASLTSSTPPHFLLLLTGPTSVDPVSHATLIKTGGELLESGEMKIDHSYYYMEYADNQSKASSFFCLLFSYNSKLITPCRQCFLWLRAWKEPSSPNAITGFRTVAL